MPEMLQAGGRGGRSEGKLQVSGDGLDELGTLQADLEK